MGISPLGRHGVHKTILPRLICVHTYMSSATYAEGKTIDEVRIVVLVSLPRERRCPTEWE
jgi:hypothetical protein